jgi:hypothetical protein
MIQHDSNIPYVSVVGTYFVLIFWCVFRILNRSRVLAHFYFIETFILL